MDSDAATIGELCELTSTSLPDDWEIRVVMTVGCLDVQLYDPEGEFVMVDDGEDAELPTMLLRRVNYARDRDGLVPVDWAGRHDPEM